MSTEVLLFCGPCGGQDRKAKKWCTNCKVGICEDCEKIHHISKRFQNHKLISIQAFRRIEKVSKRIRCQEHDKKFDWFCKIHDQPMCATCLTSDHDTCSNVLPIQIAAKEVNSLKELEDLDDTIIEGISNINQCIKDRHVAAKDIETKKHDIKRVIRETRGTINEYLDEIETKLLIELSGKYNTIESEYSRVIEDLLLREVSLEHLRDQIVPMQDKQMKLLQKMSTQVKVQNSEIAEVGSDVRIFLETHNIKKIVAEDLTSVKSEVSCLRNYKMSIELHPFISDFLEELAYFAQIRVLESNTSLPFGQTKKERVQDTEPLSDTDSKERYHLTLKQSFDIKHSGKSMYISGCCILPDSCVLIADYDGENQLMEYSDEGEHIRDIKVSSHPYALTGINFDRIAVSYGTSKYIEVLDLKYISIDKKINETENCWGISHHNGKLHTIVETKGIVIRDLSGEMLHTIKLDVSHVSNIVVYKERIYFSNCLSNTIYCYTMKGDAIWTFRDKSVIYPNALSVDKEHNVFVAGLHSNDLTLIQHDGQVSNTVRTQTDELNAPHAMYYRRDTKVLLVCNLVNGHAHLYDVKL